MLMSSENAQLSWLRMDAMKFGVLLEEREERRANVNVDGDSDVNADDGCGDAGMELLN
jgi:hypothetical protein